MRIVYATDLHGSFKLIPPLLDLTSADLYICAGDLLRRHFRHARHLARFTVLQQYFRNVQCAQKSELRGRAFVESWLSSSAISKNERAKAKEYLRLHQLAHQNILEELARLEDIFSAYPEKKIYVLPGNYDIDLKGTPLGARDLHRAIISTNGITLAGYGGAPVLTPGIPEDLSVPYNEHRAQGTLFSEPREFLARAAPDIVVLHLPPFGYFDLLRSYGHIGSVGVRDYLDQFSPTVVLCGHFHEHWGVAQHKRTIIANPSNFGQIVEITGQRQGGYFFDFILNEGSFAVGTLRILERGAIYDIADYRLDPAGPLKLVIIDERRLRTLSREKAEPGPVLKQIRYFNEVKHFFRRYETPATVRRIEDLRKIYRKLRAQGHLVAFDVLGSVNFGMSEPDSDVDLVVYRRCPCIKDVADEPCSLPKALSECFNDLEVTYQVEITDCVNLNQVEHAIRNEDPYDPALQRFVLYRSICRPINLRMIKEVETLFMEKKGLRQRVEYLLKDYFKEMVITNSHIYSFKKYEARLHDQGTRLPPRIQQKLNAYLGIHGRV